MADIISKGILNRAQKLHDQGDIAGAYAVLGQAGDIYADKAWTITNNSSLSVFDGIVALSWGVGAPGLTKDLFNGVASKHQQNYLDLTRDQGFKVGSVTMYQLPNSYQIERSYYNALKANGVPPAAAIDLDLNHYTKGFISWSWMLGLEESRRSNKTFVVPEWQDSHCFLAGTPISMWPVDPNINPDADGRYAEEAVLAAIWEKPIEQVTADDWVVSYDADGNLKPGRVKRTFRNEAKIILDFHGTFVTPGHVYYCAGGRYEGRHVPLIDILRDDGVIQHEDGTLIRASTGCEVGTDDDKTFWAFTLEEGEDGLERVREKKFLRFGTRFMLPDGRHFSMREYLDGIGVEIIESGQHEGYARFRKTGLISVFAWTLSDRLPNPEDFVLARSQTTLEDIYRAGEWDTVHPRMPAPMVMDGGPVQPMAALQSTHMRKNVPMAFQTNAPPSELKLNRKARKAEAARQRKIRPGKSCDDKGWGTLH